eukprot:COSAG06_NODE_477_length_15216_cov_133.572402_4_plen_65_part_00
MRWLWWRRAAPLAARTAHSSFTLQLRWIRIYSTVSDILDRLLKYAGSDTVATNLGYKIRLYALL